MLSGMPNPNPAVIAIPTTVSKPGTRRKSFFVPSLFALQKAIPMIAAARQKDPNTKVPKCAPIGFLRSVGGPDEYRPLRNGCRPLRRHKITPRVSYFHGTCGGICPLWVKSRHVQRTRPCPLLTAGSTDRRNTGVESLCWSFKLQGLPWPFVELTRHFVQMGL